MQRIVLSLICCISVLVTSRDAFSQTRYGLWKSSRIGGGGYLQHIVFCPSDPNRIYLTSDVGGMFRSDDKGKSWRMIHDTLPSGEGSYAVRGLIVDPADADRIITVTGMQWDTPRGAYVSDDGGRSWKQTLKNAWFLGNSAARSAGHVLIRSHENPNHIFTASVETGLFESHDHGQTWQHLGMDHLNPSDVLMDSRDAKVIWLASQKTDNLRTKAGKFDLEGGLFLSHDGGKSFEKLTDTPPLEMIQHPAHPDTLIGLFGKSGVKHSVDMGRTWQDFNSGLPKAGTGYRDPGTFRAISARDNMVLLGSTHGELYRLDDTAKQWIPIACEGVDEGDWFARMQEGVHQHFGSAMGYLSISPHDPNHWAFTDWYAYYQSFDSGKHWQLAIDGIEMTVIHCLRQDFSNPDVMHMGMADNGYFQTVDSGREFKWIHKGIPGNIKDISPNPTQPNLIYATGPKQYQWWANQVYVSQDNGQSWRYASTRGLPDMDKYRCNSITVNPQQPEEIFLAVSGNMSPDKGGPYRSVDGGKSWHWIGKGLPAGKQLFTSSIWVIGREIEAGSGGHVLIASNQQHAVYRYDRHEQTWQPSLQHLKGQPHDIIADPSTPGRFYVAVKNDGLYRTDDGGLNWQKLFDQGVSFVSLDQAHPNRLAISTTDDVLYSDNHGLSFRSIGQHIPARTHRMMLGFCGEYLLVGTGGNGVFRLKLSDLPKAQ